MLYHPLINELANLPLTFLVKPADEQHIEGQTACFCPFCSKSKAGRASQTTGASVDGYKQNNQSTTTVPSASPLGSTTVPSGSAVGSTTVPDASPSGITTTVPDASPSGITTTVPDASPSGITPHFIIYDNERGGLYNGIGVKNNQAKGGAVRWACTRTGRKGYGALELYAAIHALPLHGYGLLRACRGLVEKVYGTSEEVKKHYPMIFGKMDYRTIATQTINSFSFMPKADFNPQELAALGCEVSLINGITHFSFGGTWSPGQTESPEEKKIRRQMGKFLPSDINEDFRIYPVERVVLPATLKRSSTTTVPSASPLGSPFPSVEGRGEASGRGESSLSQLRNPAPSPSPFPSGEGRGEASEASEIIHGTPWNPLFVCFATDVIAPEGSCGCLFRPAIQQAPIVFSTTEDHSVRKVSKWLMGDNVFTYAMEHRDSSSTAVRAAINKFEPEEKYTDEREVWIPKLDRDGEETGNFRPVTEPIPTAEIKARNIVFCRTPEDALSVYYSMRSLRMDKRNDSHFQKYCWYHVAFSLGRRNFWYIQNGEWKNERLDFNAVQYQKMNRFAERVIMLYPNDISSQRDCGAIATKYSDLCYAMLPDAFRLRYNQRWQWLFGCSPRSVRDYFLTYCMTDEDNFKFDHDIRLPLYSRLKGAKNTDPFEIDYPRDPRSGKPKPPTCRVSPTKVWLFMTSHGYFRMIDPESTDLVGQYIHLDRCFVEYIDAKSIIQAAKVLLLEFIEQSWRHTDNEIRLMSDCANLIDKTFTEKSAGGLQPMVIKFADSFDARTEYFFFRNVALKITPDSITPVSYNDINFFVPSLARKPYDFTMRQLNAPFSISESEEYRQRLASIAVKEGQRYEDGSPVFSTFEIGQMRAELEEWAQTYRWQVDWHGKREQDLWPILRIVRGCSNVLWQQEQEAYRNHQQLSFDEMAVINSHFVNMLSCIGRLCFRSWDDMQSICPYLLEDDIADEKQATGGSGKSVMINLVVGCAVNVLSIDMKEFLTIADAKFALTDLLILPGKYRVVHWEDKPKGFPMKYFYNKVSSGTKVERKFGDPVIFKMEDSPLHVITSNTPLTDDDDSTIGRFPLVSFSNRFARANPQKRKPARSPKDVMRNFRMEPEHLTDTDRNQAIMLCALAVQFIMRFHTFAIAPQGNVRRRQMVQKLTESIVRYFEWFFSRDAVYGVPICTDEMFNEFMRDWADASEGKSKEYSRATFKKKIYDYCENMSITCNPKHLFENDSDKQRKCFKLQAWVTQEYFVGREWENDNTIEPKYIRYLQTSKHVFFFYRPGKDDVPKDYKELKQTSRLFAEKPDPLPYLDDNGIPVSLTDEEKERWESNKIRRQGRRPSPTIPALVPPVNTEEMPF